MFGTFESGDGIGLSFENPVNAIGLWIISDFITDDGELQLSTNIGTVNNSAIDSPYMSDLGRASFLGLVSTESFSSAYIDNFGLSSINIDDITRVSAPGPVPAAAWLLGSGLIGLAGARRKFKK